MSRKFFAVGFTQSYRYPHLTTFRNGWLWRTGGLFAIGINTPPLLADKAASVMRNNRDRDVLVYHFEIMKHVYSKVKENQHVSMA
jgi:hypothetical protein